MELSKTKQSPKLRPEDELEATLLPPSSSISDGTPFTTAIVANDYPLPQPPAATMSVTKNTIAETAIPVTYFCYPENQNDDTSELTTSLVRHTLAPASRDNENVQHAICVNSQPDNGLRRSRVLEDQVTLGTRVGAIINDEMNYADKLNGQRARVNNYHENDAVKKANLAAVHRNKEVNVTEGDKWFRKDVIISENIRVPENKEMVKQEKKSAGYEVADYDVQEYQGYEYDGGYEYKSVYD